MQKILKTSIAFIGTRGVPARYGGFETAVEEIGSRLALSHKVLVYGKYESDVTKHYKGMERITVPALPIKSFETLSRTAMAVIHAIFISRPKLVFLFNSANSPFIIPLKIAGIPVILHPDGIEWKRSKWGKLGKFYFYFAEKIGGKIANVVIADAVAIKSHLLQQHGVESIYIPYGAEAGSSDLKIVEELGLMDRKYLLLVCRFEPENHPLEILQAFLNSTIELPLVVVGHAPYQNSYQENLMQLINSERVYFLGPVWDQELLNSLYAHARAYLHGHSVGGTNPSLLRAIANATQVIAFNCPFNEEVLRNSNLFFNDAQDLSSILDSISNWSPSDENEVLKRKIDVLTRYSWESIATQYSDQIDSLT